MDPALPIAPEERLLLAMGRVVPDREEAAAAAADPAFRWERAVDLACYHRVHALLARNLDGFPVPDDARARLQQVRMAAELRNERYQHATAEAFARLAGDGIPVLLLKGAALAATVFPPGSRPLNDIDLLIRPGDYARVARVLAEAGFPRVSHRGQEEGEVLRREHEATFARRIRNETLVLDLHWRVLPPDRTTEMSALGYDLPVEALLGRARPARLGPVRALAPSPEDMFVHTATQIGIDGLLAHLGRLADLDALARKGLDGDRLVAIATAARAAGVVHLGLSLARMLGATVPEETLCRLAAACPGCAIASRAAAGPRFPFEGLRTAARVAMVPLLLGYGWHRIVYGATLAAPTARTRRMHILRPPAGAADRVRRLRAALLAAGFLALLLAGRAAEALGLARLAARLRRRLWSAVPPPEPAERRELAAV